MGSGIETRHGRQCWNGIGSNDMSTEGAQELPESVGDFYVDLDSPRFAAARRKRSRRAVTPRPKIAVAYGKVAKSHEGIQFPGCGC